tara:strand:+ start:192 stop:587 length:396 start_codon:yes stop_codon:yes gene_type:complete
MRVIFFLVIFSFITSCYKSKSDLEGLWQFHSYISEEGKKKYIDKSGNNYYWSIDQDLFLRSIEFTGSDSIFHKKQLINKIENNISFGNNIEGKITYFIENDTLYLYPLEQYLPEELNTPNSQELIFIKINK